MNIRVRGQHSRIFRCDLPSFLPTEVINDTIAHFGSILVNRLTEIAQTPRKARTLSMTSTGSQDLDEYLRLQKLVPFADLEYDSDDESEAADLYYIA